MCPSKPKPPKLSDDHVTSINAEDIVVREENNSYPAFINVNANGDEREDNNFPHFTVWPIVGAVAATLLLIYIVVKIRACINKSKAKKEMKKMAAESARDSRLEALALAPLKFHNEKFDEITEKIEQMQKVVEIDVHPKNIWNKDRFEEITEKLDKVTKYVEMPEKTGPAINPPIVVAPPPVVPLADTIAQLPPVTFLDQNGQLALRHSQMPALTFIDNGRPRRNHGRRNYFNQNNY